MNEKSADTAYDHLKEVDRNSLLRLGYQMGEISSTYEEGLKLEGNHQAAMSFLFQQFGTCDDNRGLMRRAVSAYRKVRD